MVFETTVLVSALAGLGSFLSPCILPILPGFISYLSGTAAIEAKDSQTAKTEIESYSDGAASNSRGVQRVTIGRSARINIFLNTVYFVLGFSLIFAVLGVLLNSVLVGVGNGFQHSLTSAGGLVIIGFGGYLVLSTKLRTLNFEKKMMTRIPKFKTSYITSFIFGSTFALAASHPAAAYNSLLAYSLGLGVPFLITGAFFSRATGLIKRMVKHLKYFNLAMGGILVIVGILLFTNQLILLANFPLVNQVINLGG